ncbi:MAG: class I SAM-dependent methyltransferase [Bacteroidales bacterium]|nr:MAG: class I SAM-dependent methyltransferase [Bacteroidales bacterium]
MNEFDVKASEWDNNPMHWERSRAIADAIYRNIPLTTSMEALEFGAGTGILSFMLKDNLHKIILMDSSAEMVRIIEGKVAETKADNLKPMLFDLEREVFSEKRFDLIFTQMVLHHVADVESIIDKFSKMLNIGGYLAIADLYKEDGSFHGNGFNGHNGFDVVELKGILGRNSFVNLSHKQCFIVNREVVSGEIKPFPVFLLIAKRN